MTWPHSSTRRRGGVYIAVLGSSMLVTVVGLSALMATRIERRSARDVGDLARARFHARTGIEMGLFRIGDDPNWRTTYSSGPWETRSVGTGGYALSGVDPLDGDLSDSDRDPVRFRSTGAEGEARFTLQAMVEAIVSPLEALSTAIHAGSITVKGGHTLTALGAPASTNGQLTIEGGGLLSGDVDAASIANGGTITGTVTVPAPAKPMPDPDVFSIYGGIATPISPPATIQNAVLGPGYNPWGPTNANGVYSISMAGGTLTIEDSRIFGTLLVNIPGGRVVVDRSVLLHPFRTDYPVLIVNGDVDLRYASEGNLLSETLLVTNFNPLGAPYQGSSDMLPDDVYPSEIQGLVHVTGTLLLQTTARVRGVVICEGAVTANENNEIEHDPAIYANPPEGYTEPPIMQIVHGSWQQVIN